ncbi:hypothetical protein OROMI_017750 [Orobanche minor]
MESLRCHAKYQRRMFDQAVQLVRPGGVIVYSTFHPKAGGPGLIGVCQLSEGYKEQVHFSAPY